MGGEAYSTDDRDWAVAFQREDKPVLDNAFEFIATYFECLLVRPQSGEILGGDMLVIGAVFKYFIGGVPHYGVNIIGEHGNLLSAVYAILRDITAPPNRRG
jgi:hypothetical protein